jgi:hypothetical protein
MAGACTASNYGMHAPSSETPIFERSKIGNIERLEVWIEKELQMKSLK